LIKSTCSSLTEEVKLSNCLEPLSDMIKHEDMNLFQSKNDRNERTKEYNPYHQSQQRQLQNESNNILLDQQQNESSFSYSKLNTVAVVTPSFHYPSSSTNDTSTSFVAPTFSSYDSLRINNSPCKQTTPVTVSNFVSQPSQYFYPAPPLPSLTTQNIYQSLSNSAAADAAAAIFQAYSQFNARPTSLPTILSQQTTGQQQQQQQQIRK
jgi:hypothetical protein